MMCVLAALLVISCDSSTPQAKTYTVGDKGPAGGWIFAVNENYEKGSSDPAKSWKYLEAAPASVEEGSTWGESGELKTLNFPGAGKSNMEIFREKGIEKFPAAKVCAEYNEGGFSDWYLPSLEEMTALYSVLKSKDTGIKWKDHYWTSSEEGITDFSYATGYNTSTGSKYRGARSQKDFIHPVRAFD